MGPLNLVNAWLLWPQSLLCVIAWPLSGLKSVSMIQVDHMDSADAIRAAADTLVSSSPLWSHGRVLLQTASYAAFLDNGTLCKIWHGKVAPPQTMFLQTILARCSSSL